MTSKSTALPAISAAARQREAAASAGRASGYCWVENATGPGHCTIRQGHPGRHRDFYQDVDFD